MQNISSPKVFISYTHDSREHLERVLSFTNRLRADGVDADIDQYYLSPPEGWPRWLSRQIEEADFVLLICTEIYNRRFLGEDKHRIGLGVKWEGAVLQQSFIDPQSEIRKFIPVVFSPEEAVNIPFSFRGLTYYDTSSEPGYESLYRRLTNQSEVQFPSIGELRSLPLRPRVSTLEGLRVFLCHSSKDKPDVRKLYKKISSYGAAPWLDEEDLLAGQMWQVEIPKAIRASHAVIVCLSPNAITRAGYFHKEIKFALDVLDEQPEGTIFIIPVRLEKCEIPERLGHIHCVNLFESKGFDKLMLSLRFRTEQLGLKNGA